MTTWTRLCRLAPLAAALGCSSQGHYQRAQPLAEGTNEIAIRANGMGLITDGDSTALPQAAVRYRRGINETMDVGVQVGTDGVEALGTFLLAGKDGGTRVALAPRLGGFIAGADQLWVRGLLPVLFGWGFGAHELTLGARVNLWGFDFDGLFTGRTTGFALSVGTSLGATLALGDVFRFIPEVGLIYPAYAVEDGGSNGVNDQLLLVEAGLALGFEF